MWDILDDDDDLPYLEEMKIDKRFTSGSIKLNLFLHFGFDRFSSFTFQENQGQAMNCNDWNLIWKFITSITSSYLWAEENPKDFAKLNSNPNFNFNYNLSWD